MALAPERARAEGGRRGDWQAAPSSAVEPEEPPDLCCRFLQIYGTRAVEEGLGEPTINAG